MSSDIKQLLRGNNNATQNSVKYQLKQQSVKNSLRTTTNISRSFEPHYSISLREKYLKQGPLSIEQKRFLNLINAQSVKKNTDGFL